MKIFVYYIGRARDTHANAMAAEYMKRATRWIACEMREIDPRRADPWTKHPSAAKILLDPAGRELDSAAFAAMFETGRDVVFIVGGADGLPAAWRDRADSLVSLTPLTLPHELARVVLTEQIYRAMAARMGHPYPR